MPYLTKNLITGEALSKASQPAVHTMIKYIFLCNINNLYYTHSFHPLSQTTRRNITVNREAKLISAHPSVEKLNK